MRTNVRYINDLSLFFILTNEIFNEMISYVIHYLWLQLTWLKITKINNIFDEHVSSLTFIHTRDSSCMFHLSLMGSEINDCFFHCFNWIYWIFCKHELHKTSFQFYKNKKKNQLCNLSHKNEIDLTEAS